MIPTSAIRKFLANLLPKRGGNVTVKVFVTLGYEPIASFADSEAGERIIAAIIGRRKNDPARL